MPNAKDNAKATGDTHLPEIESEDLPLQEAHPQGAGTPGTQDRERNPRRQRRPRFQSQHAFRRKAFAQGLRSSLSGSVIIPIDSTPARRAVAMISTTRP